VNTRTNAYRQIPEVYEAGWIQTRNRIPCQVEFLNEYIHRQVKYNKNKAWEFHNPRVCCGFAFSMAHSDFMAFGSAVLAETPAE